MKSRIGFVRVLFVSMIALFVGCGQAPTAEEMAKQNSGKTGYTSPGFDSSAPYDDGSSDGSSGSGGSSNGKLVIASANNLAFSPSFLQKLLNAPKESDLFVGAGVVDANDSATGDNYSSGHEHSNVQCPSGYYLDHFSVEYARLGSIKYVPFMALTCKKPSGGTQKVYYGTYHETTLYPVLCEGTIKENGTSTSFKHGDFMTAVRVASGDYIKDFRAGCSDLDIVSSGSGSSKKYVADLSNPVFLLEYGSELIGDYGFIQSSDHGETIGCDGSDEVLTGFRASRLHLNLVTMKDTFISRLKPICSKLTFKSS